VIGLNVPQMVRTETSDPMSESGHSRRYGLRKQAQGFALSKGHISRLWRQRAFSESVKTETGAAQWYLLVPAARDKSGGRLPGRVVVRFVR
jgi:hypothetical protein